MLLKGAYCVGEHFVDPHRSLVVTSTEPGGFKTFVIILCLGAPKGSTGSASQKTGSRLSKSLIR